MLGEVSPTFACPKPATNAGSKSPSAASPAAALHQQGILAIGANTQSEPPYNRTPLQASCELLAGWSMVIRAMGACQQSAVGRTYLPRAWRSNIWEAAPLLSPEMRLLVLLMDVQCTGNHVIAPRPLQ